MEKGWEAGTGRVKEAAGTVPEGCGSPALGKAELGVLSLFLCLLSLSPIVFLLFAGNPESFCSRNMRGRGGAQAWWDRGRENRLSVPRPFF